MTKIEIKRVYDDPAGMPAEDGFRVYADRLWPRGESKERFHYDLWAKDVAPSTELREWFHADRAGRWEGFRERYLEELSANPAAATLVSELRGRPLVTLLYSSRDEEHNNEIVLADFLRARLS